MYEHLHRQDPFTGEKYPLSIYHDKPSPLKVIGDPNIKRIDAGPKVTGQAKFPNDIILPHMLYQKFLRCPHSHARVTSIDVSRAKALPGVIDVLTHDDVPDLNVSPPYNFLLMKTCFQDGDEVAAVVAEEEDIAEEALSLIEVQYDVLPFVLHCEDALKPGSPVLHGDTNEVGAPWIVNRGDVDAGMNQADGTIEQKYDTVVKPWFGARDHGDIENESCTVSWENDEMVIWVSMQGPYGEANTVAGQLGLPRNKVNCRPCHSGTGFGSKGSYKKSTVMAAYFSRKLNRPVKGRFDSEGQLNVSRKQADQHSNIKVGFKNDGSLTAIHVLNVANTGVFGGRASTDAHTTTQRMWKCDNAYLEGRDAYTNTPTVGAVR